jgi:sugar fermentation stimulation protein A
MMRARVDVLLPTPLKRGTLIQRYKRFLADIRLDTGEEITAHCPNPGSMWGLKEPGAVVWVSTSDDPKRKLANTWEVIEIEGGILAGINTNRPNKLVAEALAADAIPELVGYTAKPEVKYRENSRVDFLLTDEGRPDCYLEVKNVHMQREPGLAEFPDCVTKRGAKHMADLAAMKAEGHRAVVLFVVQMTGCERFRPAADIDPGYAAAFRMAQNAGVEALCYACEFAHPDTDDPAITLAGRLPVLDD